MLSLVVLGSVDRGVTPAAVLTLGAFEVRKSGQGEVDQSWSLVDSRRVRGSQAVKSAVDRPFGLTIVWPPSLMNKTHEGAESLMC